MKSSFKSIVSTFRSFFNKKPQKVTETVEHTPKEQKAQTISKGLSNGLYDTFEANNKRNFLNKVKRCRSRNKAANQSRIINRRIAA